MENDANTVVVTDENANANSQTDNQATQENENSTNTSVDSVASTIDYKTKFSESAREAQRLFEENKILREQQALKDNVSHTASQTTDNLYPGFEDLDDEAKNNLIAYTEAVKRGTLTEVYKDPAIAFARKQYNEQVWDSAFNRTLSKFPELSESKEDFKNKYFNVNNVPENIEAILEDIAKIHLFDKAKDIGAKEVQEKNGRIDTERSTAGKKDPQVRRSLEDWQRMSQENPSKFASLAKEYHADLDSGKL